MESTNCVKKLTQRIRVNLQVCTCSAFLTQLVLSPYALAEPTGGNIVGGSGDISQSTLTTTINQNSSRLAIDWQSFNVNQNETVNFIQPGQSSIALNRILDQNASQIHGSINANGQVVLVNPNGVFFSKTATVNAGGLFASALDISTEDFMAGHMNFKALENTSGLIVNEGTLQVIDGGTLALLGQKIKNTGLLIANFGTVALAAGSDISVQFEDQTHTSITVNANTLAGILDIDEPAIFNSGLIQAHGGRVVLTARQAQGIKDTIANFDDTEAFSFDQGQVIEKDGVVYFTGPDGNIADLGEIDVSSETGDAGEVIYAGNNINHSGVINADSQKGKGGKVSFDATDTTLLTDDSVVSAQSQQASGGTVYVLGNHVGLTDNASINVSAAKGGGEVLIGGDYQGKNAEIKNAEAVYLGKNTEVIANATEDGDGGKIIVWSDKVTHAYGVLSATGGEQSGDGGFIETSSHEYVDLAPKVDVSAYNGQHGEWLIDPTNLTISTSSTSPSVSGAPVFQSNANNDSGVTPILNIVALENALQNGASITVQTAVVLKTVPFPIGCTGIACTGFVNIDPQAESGAYTGYSEGGNIILATNLDFNGADNASSLTMNAHRNIIIDGNITDSVAYDPSVTTSKQDVLNLTLNADLDGNGATVGGEGYVTINPLRTINLQGGNFTASGVSFTNAGIINTTTPGNFTTTTPGGNVNITATTSIIQGDGTLTVAGTTTLNAAGTIILNAANDFQGAVNINRGSSVLLRDSNSLIVNINNNSVTSIATNTVGNSTIVDIDPAGTVLNAMTVGGNLDVTSAGNISDSNVLTDVINVNGTSVFRVPGGSDIILNNNNNFNSTVQFLVNGAGNINNLNIRDTSAFDLQDISVDGFLTASSGGALTVNDIVLSDDTQVLTLISTGGAISQQAGSAAIDHSGSGVTYLSATGDINLADQSHKFNNVTINQAATASIDNGANAIVLNGVNANDLNVVATGGITDSDFINVTGTATLDAGVTGDITLNQIQFVGPGYNANTFNNLVITNADQVLVYEQDAINISGNMNSLYLLAGLDGLQATIDNVSGETLSVTGDTGLNFINTGSINLNNGAQSDLLGLVSIGNNFGTVTDVTIDNISNLQLDTLTVSNAGAGTLNLKSDTGITQLTNTVISVDGTTTLESVSIDLLQSNDFNDVVINDSGVVSINDNLGGLNVIANNTNAMNSIELTLTANDAVSIEGELLNMNLTTSSGGINSTNLLTVEGLATVNAGAAGTVDFQANQVNLNNLNVTLANDVLINELNGLQVTGATVNSLLDIDAAGAVSVNGDIANLDINTNNTISLSGTVGILNAQTTLGGIQNGATALKVIDTATLDAASSNVSLLNPANDISRIGITSAGDVSLRDVNALQLMDIQSNTLTVNTAGDLTQASGTVLDVTGLTSLSSGSANINLSEANFLNTLVLTANNATLVNDQSLLINNSVLQGNVNVTTTTGDLSLNEIRAGNDVTLSAADSIIDANGVTTNIIANTVSLSAVNGIGMVGSDNKGIDLQTVNLLAHNTATGDINLNNFGGDITLVSIVNDATDTGNFNFETTHDVYIDNITLQQGLVEAFYPSGTGRAHLRTAEGSFLGVGDEDINNPDITATNLRLIGVKGTLGTLQRPIVLDISGKVEILMRASLDPIYVEPVPLADIDIHDDSLLQFTSADTLAAANGVQLTEVETLLDIDPAIFTELRHFVVDADPVLLPRDQRFDVDNEDEEEDEEYFRRISGEGEVLVN